MPTYVLLSSLNPGGLETLKERPERLLEVNQEIERMGGHIKDQYAILGPFDFITIIEADSNDTVAKIAVSMGARGTVRIQTLPAHLVKSLTWDQGKELTAHKQFTIDTGVQVYFCDPHSPWQRGSNENTNGLLRQYLPRRLDFRTLTQADLDAIAQELNERPRQTLEFKTPSQALAEALR